MDGVSESPKMEPKQSPHGPNDQTEGTPQVNFTVVDILGRSRHANFS